MEIETTKYFHHHLSKIKILGRCFISQQWTTWQKVKWAIWTHNHQDHRTQLIFKGSTMVKHSFHHLILKVLNHQDMMKLWIILEKDLELNWIHIELSKEQIYKPLLTNLNHIEKCHQALTIIKVITIFLRQPW